MPDALDALRARLPDVDVAEHWARFRGDNPTSGTGEFVAHLHKDGLIDAPTLCRVVGELDVEVGDAPAGERELGLLGKGAMGEVHIARDERLRRHVAKKRMAKELVRKPDVARRFQQEVQIMAQLDHPNIAPVYRMDVDADGVPYYTMKLVRGQDLDARLQEIIDQAVAWKTDGSFALPGLLDVFLKVCDAVHYAHTRGVIHRDLKPANIMLGAHGEVLVMDWGIARRIGTGEETAPSTLSEEPDRAARDRNDYRDDEPEAPVDVTATQFGTCIGTPQYMSPEQAQGLNNKLTGASDQYALGLILGELLTLKRLVTGRNVQHLLYRATEGEYDRLVPFRKGKPLPPELVAIVAKATQRLPHNRYKDVKALADDVRRHLRDEETTARPDNAVQRAQRWVGRHRDATIASVLGLIVALLLVAGTALVGGFTLLEAYRFQAKRHEEAVSHVVSEVTLQAHRVDSRFQTWAGLLSGLAAAAEQALRDPVRADVLVVAPPEVKYRPDLVHSSVYADDLMIVTPTVLAAPGSSPTKEDTLRLGGLAPSLLHVLVGSASPDALGEPIERQVARVANQGVPVVWAYVATEDGLMVTLPGAGGYPEDYDARQQYWYNDERGRAPVWHAAKRDDSDKERLGSLVTATQSLWDRDRYLGVAALDVSLKHVVDELLAPPGVDGKVDTWLIDAAGKTVASSTQPHAGEPPAFPFGDLLDDLRERSDGHEELSNSFVAWSRLPSLDWSYVVVAPRSLVEPK